MRSYIAFMTIIAALHLNANFLCYDGKGDFSAVLVERVGEHSVRITAWKFNNDERPSQTTFAEGTMAIITGESAPFAFGKTEDGANWFSCNHDAKREITIFKLIKDERVRTSSFDEGLCYALDKNNNG